MRKKTPEKELQSGNLHLPVLPLTGYVALGVFKYIFQTWRGKNSHFTEIKNHKEVIAIVFLMTKTVAILIIKGITANNNML